MDATALAHGDQKTFDASLTAAVAQLGALDPVLKKYSVRAVGNSHIDLAWLWPSSEAMEVVRNTFSTALQLMQEYKGKIDVAAGDERIGRASSTEICGESAGLERCA